MKPLQDTDKMPFGKWKGSPMEQVPADYLHWFWQKCGRDPNTPVGAYIAAKLPALKQEYPDGIWS